ncbi:MAG: hypothetical protein DMD73_04345, partial [Gemmatimonadetes bacterium]
MLAQERQPGPRAEQQARAAHRPPAEHDDAGDEAELLALPGAPLAEDLVAVRKIRQMPCLAPMHARQRHDRQRLEVGLDLGTGRDCLRQVVQEQRLLRSVN